MNMMRKEKGQRSNIKKGEKTMLNEKLTLSIPEVAKRLGIGRSLAYQLSRSDGFPTLKLGKRVLVPIEGLNEWLHKTTKGE